MIKQLVITAALASATCQTLGDENYDHFPSLAAPDMATAYCNLATYNKKLAAIMSKAELSAEDMVKVHELTYTLENAVIRMQQTLDTLAEDLEKVHKASEVLKHETIKQAGSDYMVAINSFVKPASC